MRRLAILLLCLFALLAHFTAPAQGEPPATLPHTWHIPRMQAAPRIDGTIEPAEWQHAAQFAGVALAGTDLYLGRDVHFHVGWDARHLYLAISSDLRSGERLQQIHRDGRADDLGTDDTVDVTLQFSDTSPDTSADPWIYRAAFNPAGASQCDRVHTQLNQVAPWFPRCQVASRVGSTHWEIELALPLSQFDQPPLFRAGQRVGLQLGRTFQNPLLRSQLPSPADALAPAALPQFLLVDGTPFVQLHQLDGLLDSHLRLGLRAINPTATQQPLHVKVQVTRAGEKNQKPLEPQVIHTTERELMLESGAQQITIDQAITGIDYQWSDDHHEFGIVSIQVTQPTQPDAVPLAQTRFTFLASPDKQFLAMEQPPLPFELDWRLSPQSRTLWLAAEAAHLRTGALPVLEYKLIQGTTTLLHKGVIDTWRAGWIEGAISLPSLRAGDYSVLLKLTDPSGVELGKRTVEFTIKDEAREWSSWWNTRLGNVDRVLPPFEPLVVHSRRNAGLVECVGRTYQLDSLGLPTQITSNDGSVLVRPAAVHVTIDNRTFRVPVDDELRLVDRSDTRVRFTGQATAGPLRFTTRGSIATDGLVDLQFTFAPARDPVTIQELWIEWPIDDQLGSHLLVFSPGGPLGHHFTGAVPAGRGVVWSSLRDMPAHASGMTVGNFYQQIWVGTEQRGLLLAADSDEGYVPSDRTAAQTIVREGSALLLRQHLISTYPGAEPFTLDHARTVRLQYNASPFKPLPRGWRIHHRSSAIAHSSPGYKIDTDTGYDGWHLLSPPTAKLALWPRYLDYCREQARAAAARGIYSPAQRLLPFTANRTPLRTDHPRTLEPGLYDYFQSDWLVGHTATLAPSYINYMLHLQQQLVDHGGCAHFHFDQGHVTLLADPARGFGYRLPDGRVQPAGGCDQWRLYAMRLHAMMQEHQLKPAGLSAGPMPGVSLKAMPWLDAVTDAPLLVADATTPRAGAGFVPSARMIALSCPHNFGVAINHLPAVNPHWAAMHDASTVAGVGSPFDSPDFLHWGIAEADVRFVPYWRNRSIVTRIADGQLASIWLRPGSAVVGVTLLPGSAAESSAELALSLNLQALGVPAEGAGDRVTVRELMRDRTLDERYYAELDWYRALPPVPISRQRRARLRPQGNLQFDARTGSLTGLPLFAFDTRYILIDWTTTPPDQARVPFDLRNRAVAAALEWGIDQPAAEQLDERQRFISLTSPPDLRVQVWKRPDRVLLQIENAGPLAASIIGLDLAELGVAIAPDELWNRFVGLYDLENRRDSVTAEPLVHTDLWPTDQAMLAAQAYREPGSVLFDAQRGRICVKLAPDDVRLISIEKY